MKLKCILIILLFNLMVFSNAMGKKQAKPNILFILLDDMGKEWVSSYGADDIETPTIDALAHTGIKFDNAYSMPQCTPSRVTLITGQYPYRHGWVNHYDVPRWGHGARFDANQNPSYARMLKKVGYKTCAAGKWQINDFRLEPDAMVKVGFDEYCMWTGAEGGNVEVSQERYWNPYIHTRKGSRTYYNQFGEDVFTDFIIDFMQKNKEDPMMIYYAMCLPHGPLTTTPAEPSVSGKERHKAMVRYTDVILKKLLKALEDLNIRENTLVFWTTDNGTSGNIIGHMNGKPVRGGKTYLTENGINAPLIVNAPGLVPGGRVSDELVDFTDILPTFCDIAGAKRNEDFEFDGKSIASLIFGEKETSDRKWIMGMGSRAARIEGGKVKNAFVFRDRVFRDKNYKAYVDTSGVINELIDLKNDFYEQTNILDKKDPKVISALEKFKEAVAEMPEKDSNPLYQTWDKSFYNIPVEELLKDCLKSKYKSNKSKLPF